MLFMKRPKTEIRNLQPGMSLAEILAALAVSTIVLATVSMIASLSLKMSGKVNASLSLDEEITKLHTSIRSIVSRQWTLLAGVPNVSDGVEGAKQAIVLSHSIPEKNVLGWETALSTITYISSQKQIVHIFDTDENGGTSTSILASFVDNFSVEPIENYLKYDSTFTYYSPSGVPILRRRAQGAVRFY